VPYPAFNSSVDGVVQPEDQLVLLGWIVAQEPCIDQGQPGLRYLVFIGFPNDRVVGLEICLVG